MTSEEANIKSPYFLYLQIPNLLRTKKHWQMPMSIISISACYRQDLIGTMVGSWDQMDYSNFILNLNYYP